MYLLVLHVELDPEGDLGEDGNTAEHDDLISHPGHGPNLCEGLDSHQTASVAACHLHSI